MVSAIAIIWVMFRPKKFFLTTIFSTILFNCCRRVYQMIPGNRRFKISVEWLISPNLKVSSLHHREWEISVSQSVFEMLSDLQKTSWASPPALPWWRILKIVTEDDGWVPSKSKRHKIHSNSGCILISRINQRSSSRVSPPESVLLVCSGT